MAMLPFCGYNMADYFEPLADDRRASTRIEMPRIFVVNWFRKDADGKFLWPGFGENSRVLEWIFRRCDGEGETVETPIGLVPAEGELDTRRARDLRRGDARAAHRRRRAGRRRSCRRSRQFLAQFGDQLPAEISEQLEALRERLG